MRDENELISSNEKRGYFSGRLPAHEDKIRESIFNAACRFQLRMDGVEIRTTMKHTGLKLWRSNGDSTWIAGEGLERKDGNDLLKRMHDEIAPTV